MLVNEYLEAIEKDPQKGSYPQMGLYLQDPTPEDLEERFGLKAPHYYKVYTEFVKGMDMLAHNFLVQFEHTERKNINVFIEEQSKLDINTLSSKELTDYCIKILEHLRNTTCINFVKAARLGFYYSQKVLKLLQNKFSMDKEDAFKAFSNLTQGLDGSAITNLNISIAEAATDEEALNIAKKRMGHFSTGEMLEIRHLRMRDVPGVLHTYVKGIRDSGQYVELYSKQKMERLMLQDQLLAALEEEDRENVALVFQHAQTYMALRETIKYLFSMEYSLIKDGLELLEAKLELNSGDIYYLFPREIVECEMDLKSMVHLIESRKRSFQNYKKLEIPDVIRENDIHHLNVLKNHSVDFDELIGSFLAQGQPVEGVVLNLDEIISFEEAYRVITEVHGKKEKIILVSTQMNLQHDPFIALSDGLVIEKASIVAHGAQRARELGKGAIGGVKSSILTTGMRVLFDPDKRSIRKMNGTN
ncbi:phosphohistidine swiveling domain-containing protein [Fontibacillus solani]|uniref:Phosphohistidine swiveling domain-containing protein n=1 Tax=Fontibacillus solani TaxID=1572857 RepID=A0A7W3SYW2_9BACL|nr:hypothetical protein [Fontibacillus solani]MBA9088679.1 phosphohistidine swiveling domain-containing protein [Fontibacillus solani]